MSLENPLDPFAATRIFRRLGQLGIPYEDAITSPYARKRGWSAPQFKVGYRDGANGTYGWGTNARALEAKHIVPFNREELLRMLNA